MATSKIEWCDATWNPVRGCTKISPGCSRCYAETFAERWRGVAGHPYEQGFDLKLVPHKLEEPLHSKQPKRIFINSMSDLFHDGVPFEYIDKVVAVAIMAHWHTFQALTKRADRMLDYWSTPDRAYRIACALLSFAKPPMPIPTHIPDHLLPRLPLKNWWHGVSVESRDYLKRIDILKDVPAAVRFVSFEPLLEDLGAVILDRIHWAIIGGESGPGARPLHIKSVRSLLQQCREQKVAPFVKQMGSYAVERNDRIADVWYYADGSDMDTEAIDGDSYRYQGAPVRLKLKSRKGGDPEEWPSDLRE